MQKLFYFLGIVFFVIGSVVLVKLYFTLDHYEENKEKIDKIVDRIDKTSEKIEAIGSGELVSLIRNTNITLEQTSLTLSYVNQNIEKINSYLSGNFEKLDEVIEVVKSVYDISVMIKDSITNLLSLDIDLTKYLDFFNKESEEN